MHDGLDRGGVVRTARLEIVAARLQLPDVKRALVDVGRLVDRAVLVDEKVRAGGALGLVFLERARGRRTTGLMHDERMDGDERAMFELRLDLHLDLAVDDLALVLFEHRPSPRSG